MFKVTAKVETRSGTRTERSTARNEQQVREFQAKVMSEARTGDSVSFTTKKIGR
jgi:hypothetical protein